MLANNLRRYLKDDGTINVRLEDFSNIQPKKLVEDLAELISSGELKYPFKKNYMKHPDDLIGNETLAVFEERHYVESLPDFLQNEVRLYKGREIALVFTEEDYDRLDIITDFFTEEARMGCNVKKFSPPVIGWKKKSYDVARMAVQIAIDTGKISTYELSEGIYRSGIKMCTTFKVSVAMAIYDGFRAKKVLDISSGWGDRIIAASLSKSVTTYVGTDPNHELMSGYEELVKYFKTKNDKKLLVYNHQFEELPLDVIFGDPKGNSGPDLIFTSPPFFDYEIYSTGDKKTQSINGYDTFDNWVTGWLVPVTLKAWQYLKVNGHLVYHLGHIDKNNMAEGIINTMKTIKGAVFKGQIPLINREQPTRRPVFIYVWLKTGHE
jgi:hypothetical protein